MKKIIIAAAFLLALLEVSGQAHYEYKSSQGDIQVSGTSSMHDWEMDVLTASGQIIVNQEEGILSGITQVTMTISSTSIVSGNNVMDKKTKKAIKAELFPEIIFRSSHVEDLQIEEQGFSGIVAGNLEVSGVISEVRLHFQGSLIKGCLRISGTHTLLMSDFDIVPPTAMMGAMKTGDKVIIKFNTEWNTK